MICGVDEAGRGPWAGPVVAAAVILPVRGRPKGLGDSKTIAAPERERLFADILAMGLVGIGEASAAEIDALNIRQATFLAMGRAFEALARAARQAPIAALVDGSDPPPLPCAVETIVDGDAHIPLIGAASIIAKVTRDRFMADACAAFPDYGFARHKGYGVPEHAAALERLGPCALHRLTFKPVAAAAARHAARAG